MKMKKNVSIHCLVSNQIRKYNAKLVLTILAFLDSLEAIPHTESHIPNSKNPFPVADALFEDTDHSTYDLSNTTTGPARINGIKSRVNGSSTLPSTSSNDSKYTLLYSSVRFTYFCD